MKFHWLDLALFALACVLVLPILLKILNSVANAMKGIP
jgi:hypothetical protein